MPAGNVCIDGVPGTFPLEDGVDATGEGAVTTGILQRHHARHSRC